MRSPVLSLPDIGDVRHRPPPIEDAAHDVVLGRLSRDGTATGRASMEVIPDFTQQTMTAFACANIEPGTTIITDKLTGSMA